MAIYFFWIRYRPTDQSQKIRKTLSIIHEEGLLLLGVCFFVGHSGSQFISSLIDNMIMPFISRVFSEVHWEHAHFMISEVKIT